jgi:tetratricopeptide (TPR) repeat protein
MRPLRPVAVTLRAPSDPDFLPGSPGRDPYSDHMRPLFPYGLAPTATIVVLLSAFCACGTNGPETGGEVAARPDAFHRAMDSVNALIVARPKDPALYDGRSQIYLAVDSLRAATLDLERALALDSTNVNRQLRLGDLYYRQTAVESAKKCFESATRLEPQSTQAKLKLAEIALLLRQYRESMDLVNDALRIDQHAAHGYYLKGWIHMETGDTTLALSSFATAVEQDPQDYPVYIMLGKLHAARHDPLAEQYYRTALTIRPRSTEAWYNLGMYQQENGQDSAALESYRRIMEIDSSNALAWYNTGWVQLEHLNDVPSAKTNFSKAIALAPGYVNAWFNRGLSMEKLNELDSAAANYQMVLAMDPAYKAAAAGLDRLQSKGVRIKMREQGKR